MRAVRIRFIAISGEVEGNFTHIHAGVLLKSFDTAIYEFRVVHNVMWMYM